VQPSVDALGARARVLAVALILPLSAAPAACNALLGNSDVTLATNGDAQVGHAPEGGSDGTGDSASGDEMADARPGAGGGNDGGDRDGGTGGDGAGSDGAGSDGAGSDGAGGTADGGESDGAPDGDSGNPGLCDPAAPFASKTLVQGLPGGVEIHGRLSPDEKTLWFDTNFGTIFVGTRQSVGGSFTYKGLAADGSMVSFTGNDVFPTVSDDLKTLYFLNGGTNQLAAATRSDTTLPFVSDGGALPIPSPQGAQYRAPFVTGSTLYYGLFANGFPGSEIYFSDISGNSVTSPQIVPGFPLAQAGAGGADGERFPVVSRDGNTIYFLDDGSGSVGEIYVAHRAQSGDPFTTASPVTELNSGAGEQPMWLSFDQCRLYFMSFHSPMGLYVASR
jgi:WD40-like Beta Propeller Repeat